MAPWTVSFGTRVLLVDGDEERLMRAVALLEKLVDADRANETGVPSDEGEAVSGKFPPRPRREGLPALELVPAVQFISAEELRGSSMLEGFGAVDLVKVDIDSIDCEALRAVLCLQIGPHDDTATEIVRVTGKLGREHQHHVLRLHNLCLARKSRARENARILTIDRHSRHILTEAKAMSRA